MRENSKRIFHNTIIIFSTIIFSFLILTDRSATIFRQIYIKMRYGFSVTVILLATGLFIVSRLSFTFKKQLFFAVIILFFMMALAGVWASGISEPTMISGIIPIVDGENYYTDALRIINDGKITYYSQRHPIFTAFLASLICISQGQIQIVQLILTFFLAISTYFFFMGIRKRLGDFPAILAFILIFFYSRIFIGCFLTEILGLVLSSLGFLLLIQNYSNMKHWKFFFSLFLISLALVVRAGTFFVIPCLLLWILLAGGKNRWKYLLFGFISMIFPFIINSVFISYFGDGMQIPFSNYAYIFYGLAKGGAGWSQIMTDYPSLFLLDEVDVINKIWKLNFELIKNNPIDLFKGLSLQYYYLINIFDFSKNLFSFMSSDSFILSIISQILFFAISFWGILNLRKHEKRFAQMIGLILLGFIISVPFVPIQDTRYMRAYSATMPIIFIIASVGLNALFKEKIGNKVENHRDACLGLSFVLGVLFLALILPFFISNVFVYEDLSLLDCENGYKKIITNISDRSSIRVFPENEFFLDWAPNFHLSRYYKNVRVFGFSGLIDPISNFPPPFELRLGMNLLDNEDIYLLLPGDDFLTDFGIYEFCVEEVEYEYSPWNREIAQLYIAHDHRLITER